MQDNLLLWLTLFMILGQGSELKNNFLDTTASKTKVRSGDLVRISITAKKQSYLSWQALDSNLKRDNNVLLFKITTDTLGASIRHDILLTAVVGTLKIPATVITGKNSKDALYTKPISLTFLGQAMIKDIHEIAGPRLSGERFYLKLLEIFLLMIIPIITTIVLVLAFFRFGKKVHTSSCNIQKLALIELRTIEQNLGENGDDQHINIKRIFLVTRQYLESIFGTDILTGNDQEVRGILKQARLSLVTEELINDFLHFSQRIRFSRQQMGETHVYLELARIVIGDPQLHQLKTSNHG